MSKITNIHEIESIRVHWSESSLISDELGYDEEGDIEKDVSPDDLDDMVKRAAAKVGGGYDKTSLTIKLKDGRTWCDRHKFYLHGSDSGLLSMIKSER